jgi:hypothetical protein
LNRSKKTSPVISRARRSSKLIEPLLDIPLPRAATGSSAAHDWAKVTNAIRFVRFVF